MIHLYYGDGKGKTSAAMGLAIRAAGSGMKVHVIRFMKTDQSGEVNSLQQIENITLQPCTRTFGFTFRMTEEQKKEAKEYYTNLFFKVIEKESLDQYNMIIMDESAIVYHYDFIPKQEFKDFLKKYGQEKEIVITGAFPQADLIELADYASEIKKVKHPYDKGVKARKGIEF